MRYRVAFMPGNGVIFPTGNKMISTNIARFISFYLQIEKVTIQGQLKSYGKAKCFFLKWWST